MITSSIRRSASRLPSWCPALASNRSFTSSSSTDNVSTAALATALATTPTPNPDDFNSLLWAGMSAIDSLHTATGLPWWASIVTVSITVRTAMLPISLKGMKASAALFPLIKQARTDLTGNSTSSNKEEETSKTKPDAMALVRRFHQLRQQTNAPHPIWIIASPFLQLPAFILAMTSVRSMSLSNWPGFHTGGLAWFPDLTLPALDLSNISAPLGSLGIILPLTIALSMHANIQAAFRVAPGAETSNPTLVWVMSNVKLLLEWAVVPLFGIALQLPHGAVCYWATSSVYALGQNYMLRLPAVREYLGLIPKQQGFRENNNTQTSFKALGMHQNQSIEAAAEDADVVSNSTTTTRSAASYDGGENTTSNKSRSTSKQKYNVEEMNDLFHKAASLHAAGNSSEASNVLESIIAQHPENAKAHFALGQVSASLKDWSRSQIHYSNAAQLEEQNTSTISTTAKKKEIKHQKARALFGAAVAFHMLNNHEQALETFQQAAELAQSDDLKVRAWVSQATLHKKLGNVKQAVTLLEKAAKIEPKVDELYLQPLLKSNDQS